MKPCDDMIYTYDGTMDGLLTCIFEAYDRKEKPEISRPGNLQLSIGAQVREISTDCEKAERVYKGIRDKLGQDALELVFHATLSAETDTETALLEYICLGFSKGRKAFSDLADGRVLRMRKLAREIWREENRYVEFLRFSEIEGGILFAEFEPETNILPIIMTHFADRLNAIPFIIHDKRRLAAGVYNTNEWAITPSSGMHLPDFSENEKRYREMWKLFYDTIAVQERVNERLRMRHMPRKYWPHMTEMRQYPAEGG